MSTPTAPPSPPSSLSSQSVDPVMDPRPDAGAPPPPVDAILLVSFGGPEGPDDVVPFLENVTRGRGIPRERLAEVGKHYGLFGGRSPINDQCRALLAALRAELAEHGPDLPVYWGNRNWDPYLPATVQQMADDGVRHAVAVFTSAYSSYSSCRQYREDVARAQAEVGPGAPLVTKVRHYFNHPGFVEPTVDAVSAALASLPDPVRDGARLLFTAHSIPTPMAERSGPDGGAYVGQLASLAEVVAARFPGHDHELVFQSRSGPPTQPWLEPDVVERVTALHAAGTPAVVLVPIGFTSDHMEVLYDLDTEARARADELGLPMARAATVGTDPRFVRALRELVLEVVEQRDERPAVGSWGPSHRVCPGTCCPAPVRPVSAQPARAAQV